MIFPPACTEVAELDSHEQKLVWSRYAWEASSSMAESSAWKRNSALWRTCYCAWHSDILQVQCSAEHLSSLVWSSLDSAYVISPNTLHVLFFTSHHRTRCSRRRWRRISVPTSSGGRTVSRYAQQARCCTIALHCNTPDLLAVEWWYEGMITRHRVWQHRTCGFCHFH